MRAQVTITLAALLVGTLPATLAATHAHASPTATIAHPPAAAPQAMPAKAKPRATITASQQTQASGKVLVTVTSNAKKVKITYRTATNKKRSTTVRLRAGQRSKLLAAGATRIYARANATSKLRASPRIPVGTTNPAPPPPTVWHGDADGNGTLDFSVDFEPDGTYDALILDQNGNGRFEVAYVRGPLTAGIFLDRQEDGYFEVVAIDDQADGRLERIFEDRDQDGYPEIQWLDLIGADGIAETQVNSTPSAGTPEANTAANDLMVQHIVTMNQLRALNPASTGYIPYNPAPSLIRDQYSSTCLQCRRW